MITPQLINPQSIVVVGGSNDIHKPGGKVLKNLLDGNYKGKLYVLNPKADSVQGVKSYRNIEDLPPTDLAIIAIVAKYTVETVKFLAEEKNTKAFIILSAGFGEESEQGAKWEKELTEICNKHQASLIGPNCIGVLNTNYNGVFTTPIPKLNPKGIDMISGSGATAVFIMESALPKGLTFNSIWSVGNSAQIGVEDILEYMDETFDENSPKIKLLYLEKINNPQKFLKHASSLIKKGCKIAAIKAGSSEAGSRAASSHTGALASSDIAVDALFRKAGIVRCYGREELVTVAAILQQKELKGNRIAVVTHAGGPGVMLTDALSNGGMEIPTIDKQTQEKLLEKLFPGSSAANPIDFLATGTAEQLDYILTTVENLDYIDASAVIFGTPGLVKVFDAYEVIHKHIVSDKKPIYPVMPSTSEAAEEIKFFQNFGHQSFHDEVLFGQALAKVWQTPKPLTDDITMPADIDKQKIREIIDSAEKGKYLHAEQVAALLDAAGIPRAKEYTAHSREEATEYAQKLQFPLVMKVTGVVHKSDVGGVSLNITDMETVKQEFDRMMKIPGATGVLLQPMLTGKELFIGAKYEPKFGHTVLAGLGGIFVEILKDVNAALAPLNVQEALLMIKKLKGYKILEGARGEKGIDIQKFAEIIVRTGFLVNIAPEIKEMDINPLLADEDKITAVDARILL